ncbi:hypothetical protein V8D89_007465 [Ganoderma adspersum]
MSSYSEISSPPGSVDWESDSPVLVGQPHPCRTTRDGPLPSVDQYMAPAMENPTGAQTEDPGSVQNISDVDREPEKLELTLDYQHRGDLASPVLAIPSYSIPLTEDRISSFTPLFPPSPASAEIEDGVKAVPGLVPRASPEVVVSNVPHTSSSRERVTIYPASSSESISPRPDTSSTPAIKGNNATPQVPRRPHFVVSEPASPPPRSPSSDVSDIIPPRLSPTNSSESSWMPPAYHGVVPVSPSSRCRTPFSASPSPITVIPPPSYLYPIHPPIPSRGDIPYMPHRPQPPVLNATYPFGASPYLSPQVPQVIHRYATTTSSAGSGGSFHSRVSMPSMGCFMVPPPVRDDQLWFEDGNIVLHASDVEFRVYKGPLLALSPILKAKYGDPHISYLPLSDTHPSDLRHVLRFVYGGTSRIEPSFNEISAHIRFGHNYKAEKLVQRGLGYLKNFYVSELAAWLQLPSLDPPFFEPVHAIGVVNLARLLGKDGEGLLPIALMRCCTLGAGIVEGYTREDGNREMLSPADLGRCFEGRVKLLEASVRAAETLRTHTTSDECSRPQRCKAALQRFIAELVGSGDSDSPTSGVAIRDALCCLRWDLSLSLSPRRAYLQEAGADAQAVGEEKLCARCFARQLEEQRKIFAKLPHMMGVSVEGWATKGRAAA